MRQARIVIAMVVCVVGGYWLLPCTAYACSCAAGETPEQGRDRATAVFAGMVTAIDQPPRGAVYNSMDLVRVTFAVAEVWKGPAVEQIAVFTTSDGGSCGYSFSPNTEYVVYAQEIDGKLQASSCSRTAPLLRAGDDLLILGRGTTTLTPTAIVPPLPTARPTPEPIVVPAAGPSSAEIGIALAGLLVGGIAVAALIAWRTSRS